MSDNLAHAVAGACGGVVSTVVTYPLITVSSRLQVQKDDHSGDAYKGFLDGVKKIIKKEGPAGLFSGVESALFAITNGVYYYWYEFVKSVFTKTSQKRVMSTWESMAAGAVAGAATVMITNPIWVVNVRVHLDLF
jgi:adenine nucleotide transporter 17